MIKLNDPDKTLVRLCSPATTSLQSNSKTQTGKEWANQRQPYFLLMVALGADKESISLGADSGRVSPGVALSVLLKMETVVQSTRWAEKQVLLQGWKVVLSETYLGLMEHKPRQVGPCLTHPL